ncbi:chitinase-3-like protein 1 [Venturia canescens]|uniref:chitinase-3-like protein 1 n=1 Tax=Venturia canescens TaxID=32260 RepID=UPI001C9C8FEA|nr:chitinase-3-like protein 1 [Venturia canescens]
MLHNVRTFYVSLFTAVSLRHYELSQLRKQVRKLTSLTWMYKRNCTAARSRKKVICYLGSWSTYRQGDGKFQIEDIDPSLCTHLIYSFVGVTNNDVKILDPELDLNKNGFSRFNELRKKNPELKTMVAVGGWTEGSAGFSRMASNPSSRGEFVKNVVAFIKKYKFNGLDMDWEYPAQRDGASPADVDNFVALLKELRATFDREKFLLSAAVGAAESSASKSYNIPEISKYLHFINLMTYDLHGYWDRKTGMHSALYSASSEIGDAAKRNIDVIVKYWLSQGTPKEKLILGTPLYGRSFTINSGSNAVDSVSSGPGAKGIYTGEGGLLGYNEICELIKNSGWQVKFDVERRVPYAYHANQWVSFDNVKSMTEKAEFVNKMGLGGAMVWSIDTDDFKGNCGIKYPLLKTLNAVLRNGESVTDPRAEASLEPTNEGTAMPVEEPQNPTYAENDAECTAAGAFPDPTNCNQFFYCVADGIGNFIKYPASCPTKNLCFNKESGFCDWS